MIKVPLLPPFLHAKAQLLPSRQEIHSLPRRQYPHNLLHRAQPQTVRLLQNLGHGTGVLIQGRIHIGARASAGGDGDGGNGVIQEILLQGGQARGEIPLLPYGVTLQVVHRGQLARGELAQAGEADAVEELSELGLDLEAAEGVDEADVGGGAAAADPEHGALERGAPGGGEVGRDVEARHLGSLFHVIFEMRHDFVDELTQLGVGGAVG